MMTATAKSGQTVPVPSTPSAENITTAGNHFAWAKGETEIQVHGVGPWTITYVNPTDDPRKKQ